MLRKIEENLRNLGKGEILEIPVTYEILQHRILYDFKNNAIGFAGDAFSQNVYDKEATTELRNIFQGLEKDIFIDDDKLLFQQLFFIMVEIASQQIKSNDWTFKSSFLKLLSISNSK